jgi:hypothetical protein
MPRTLKREDTLVRIYYDDGRVVHACDSSLMHAGPPVVLTKCDKHVPPNEDFTLEHGTIEITCKACLARAV